MILTPRVRTITVIGAGALAAVVAAERTGCWRSPDLTRGTPEDPWTRRQLSREPS
jgi:hypothetical protein